jgi:hypothetical protein
MDTDSLLALAPERVDVGQPLSLTMDGRKLISFGQQLVREGQRWKEDLGLESSILKGLDFLAGRQFEMASPERGYRARVVANHFRGIVMREVGLLTDTVPVFKVTSRSGNDIGAEVATDVMQAIWRERNGQQFYTQALLQAIVTGCAPCMPIWDQMMDMGWGDIRFALLDNDQCIVDRNLRRADALQDEAQYVIIRIPRPLAQFRLLYPGRGHLVKPDQGLTQFATGGEETPSSGTYHRPSREAAGQWQDSAIPRAWEYRCYFVDYALHPEKGKTDDGRHNFMFPRKRCFIWSGETLLADGDAINWDGRFPLEIMDWGYALDHPYGESELTALMPLQIALNLLLSGIVHNARLQNQPPRMLPEGAMTPDEALDLERYGDMPGKHFFYRGPNPPVDRPPQTMPAIVFQTLQMLQGGMETISGMLPVAQGQRQSGITSGVAIDSLQQAAQVPIRLNSRRAESFLSRFGQLTLSRALQYYSDDRIIWLTEGAKAFVALAQRQQFIDSLITAETEEEMERLLQQSVRDFQFQVENESGLGIAKMQKIAFAERQQQVGNFAGVEVLKTAGIPNPEEKIQEAEQGQARKAAGMMGLKALMAGAAGGGGAPIPGRRPPGNRARDATQQQQVEQTRRNGVGA